MARRARYIEWGELSMGGEGRRRDYDGGCCDSNGSDHVGLQRIQGAGILFFPNGIDYSNKIRFILEFTPHLGPKEVGPLNENFKS